MKRLCKVLVGLLALAALALALDMGYGYLFRERVVADALDFPRFPEECRMEAYRYFPGGFQAVLVCEGEDRYDGLLYDLYDCLGIVRVDDVAPDIARRLELSYLEGKEILEAVSYTAELPPHNVCGYLCRLEGETLLYVGSPWPEALQAAGPWPLPRSTGAEKG